jgi:hypothetical protein
MARVGKAFGLVRADAQQRPPPLREAMELRA